MGKRWYTKKRIEVNGKILWYVGSCKIRERCKRLIDKEKAKAGKTKLIYRIIKDKDKYRTFVGRKTAW